MAQTEVRHGGADYSRCPGKEKQYLASMTSLVGAENGAPGPSRRTIQTPESLYNLRPLNIASIESAGIVPPSS